MVACDWVRSIAGEIVWREGRGVPPHSWMNAKRKGIENGVAVSA
jgi:hypothetical protein